MKITIDKKQTSIWHYENRIKDDVKQFKAAFTDNDLFRAFDDYFGFSLSVPDVMTCDVEAYEDCGETNFCVMQWLYSGDNVYRVRFYVDGALNILHDWKEVITYRREYERE